VEDLQRSDVVFLDTELGSGEGQVAFKWADSNREQWLLSTQTNDIQLVFQEDGPDGRPTWATWIKVPCSPEAALFVHFAWEDGRLSPLIPGAYPIVLVSFDVPDREQSTDNSSLQVDGDVIITEVSEGHVSGHLQGWGSGALKSNLTQEALGVKYTVGAQVFKEVPGQFVGEDK